MQFINYRYAIYVEFHSTIYAIEMRKKIIHKYWYIFFGVIPMDSHGILIWVYFDSDFLKNGYFHWDCVIEFTKQHYGEPINSAGYIFSFTYF